MGCVYQAKNKINGKCYIGQTMQDLRIRMMAHYKSPRKTSLLTEAIEDYGLESFTWIMLFESDDRNQLRQMENEFIFLKNTIHPNGYNINYSGGECVISNQKRLKKKLAKAEEKERYRQMGIII